MILYHNGTSCYDTNYCTSRRLLWGGWLLWRFTNCFLEIRMVRSKGLTLGGGIQYLLLDITHHYDRLGRRGIGVINLNIQSLRLS